MQEGSGVAPKDIRSDETILIHGKGAKDRLVPVRRCLRAALDAYLPERKKMLRKWRRKSPALFFSVSNQTCNWLDETITVRNVGRILGQVSKAKGLKPMNPQPSSRAPLLGPGPLRTGREAFASSGSGPSNASFGETRFRCESAGVARLAPCPICRPSSPARYALGVGERCGRWLASQWHTILPLRLRPHQQLALSSSALSHEPIYQAFSCEGPERRQPAFASGDVIQIADATGVRSIAERHSLFLSSDSRIAVVSLAASYPLGGAIRTCPVPLE